MAADHPATRTNLIAHADWFVCELAPGLAVTPGDLEALGATWHHAPVPGTAAAAMLASGMHPSGSELDGMDWWWRCDVLALPGVERYQLQVDGVATIWEIWLDDDRILHGDNMYLGQTIELDLPAGIAHATVAYTPPTPKTTVFLDGKPSRCENCKDNQLIIEISQPGHHVIGPR